jgi:hypothetical protein
LCEAIVNNRKTLLGQQLQRRPVDVLRPRLEERISVPGREIGLPHRQRVPHSGCAMPSMDSGLIACRVPLTARRSASRSLCRCSFAVCFWAWTAYRPAIQPPTIAASRETTEIRVHPTGYAGRRIIERRICLNVASGQGSKTNLWRDGPNVRAPKPRRDVDEGHKWLWRQT